MGQMYLDPYLTAHKKSNANFMAFLDVESETIKPLESNVEECLHGLGMGKDLYDRMTKLLII